MVTVTDRSTPVVSVIIATFNWSAALRCAIRSVLGQRVQAFEVLVVGDACTDDSEAVVAAFDDPRIRWHNLDRNYGSQWAPNNEGLRHARGEWIAYLGHDDIWHPAHLESALRTAHETGADFVASVAVCYGPSGSGIHALTGVFAGGRPSASDFIPPSSIMHRRTLADTIGGWRDAETSRLAVDCAFVVDAMSAGARIASTHELTVFKFNAAWRRDAYKVRSTDEQTSLLGRLASGEDVRHRELLEVLQSVVDDKFHRFVMTTGNDDRPGAVAVHNRQLKGVEPRFRPDECHPILEPTRFELTDQRGAFEWHLEERDERFGSFRWTGPLTTSTIELPVMVDRDLEVRVHVLHAVDDEVLRSVRVAANGRSIAVDVHVTESGTSMLSGRISLDEDRSPSGDLRLALEVARTRRPLDLGVNDDRRWLGLAVNWVELAPVSRGESRQVPDGPNPPGT